MSQHQRKLREELARLQHECQQRLEEFTRAFESEVRSLTNRYPDGSELFFKGLDDARDRLHRKLQTQMAKLQALAASHLRQPPPPVVTLGDDLDSMPRRLGPNGRWLKRRPRKRPNAGGVLVEPNKPNNLSGGAAAALEFDRD